MRPPLALALVAAGEGSGAGVPVMSRSFLPVSDVAPSASSKTLEPGSPADEAGRDWLILLPAARDAGGFPRRGDIAETFEAFTACFLPAVAGD